MFGALFARLRGRRPRALFLRTPDHPEARGDRARPGTPGYRFTFTLDDGGVLFLDVGLVAYERMRAIIASCDRAEAIEEAQRVLSRGNGAG